MTLSRLELTNFRTYKKFSQDFGEQVIFVGPNGIGKTNLLEAMYLLAILKSYRAINDAETIRFGEEFAKIKGRIQTVESGPATRKTSHDELEIVIYKGQKRAKKNGAEKPLSQLIGTLKAVLFSPEQLDIVTGPPRRRRRFLDSLLSQVDHRYTQNLLEYQKSLQNRNALLLKIKQGGAKSTELFFWDKRLVESGAAINSRRRELVDYFNKELATLYRKIADTSESLRVNPSLQAPTHDLFQKTLSYDIHLAATTTGPHRDNFILTLSERDLSLFGSRGEWRSALYALKVAEVSFLHSETESGPILLLDDVFSELDGTRRERILSEMQVGQLFLTTTDLGSIAPALREKAQIIEVANYAKS